MNNKTQDSLKCPIVCWLVLRNLRNDNETEEEEEEEEEEKEEEEEEEEEFLQSMSLISNKKLSNSFNITQDPLLSCYKLLQLIRLLQVV